MESRQFYYPIKDLMAEASERALYRSKTALPEGFTPEILMLSEEDYPMLREYLKESADNVFTRLQTLMKGENPYEYTVDTRIVYNLSLPENFDANMLGVLYTLIKDYIVEGVLLGFYMERGYDKGIQLCSMKQLQQYDKMQVMRMARTKPITRKYTMI